MFRTFAIIAAAGIAGAVCLGGTDVSAQPAKVTPGFVGSAPSSVAGCPYLAWRLARHPDGTVTGIAYYADLSGVSQVTGNINSAGQIQLTLASQMGQGPTGTVTGHRTKNGAGEVTLTGPGCANMHMTMHPVSNISEYHTANG